MNVAIIRKTVNEDRSGENVPENNLKVLDTDYAKEQYAKYAKQQKQVIFRRRRLMVIFTVAAVIFVSVGISIFNDYLRLNQLKEVKQETIVQQVEVEGKVADLQREVALLKDEDYIAKVARSRFLYSKEDELVFPIPGNSNTVEEEPTSEESEE